MITPRLRSPSEHELTSFTNAGVVLFAKELATMTAFYADVLDVPVPASRDDTIAVLECGGMRLVLHAIPAPIAETIEIAQPPARREDAAMKLSLPVRSFSRVRALASGHGGALDAEERAWEYAGRRYCDGHDPEGNVVQFHEVAAHPA